MSILFAIVLDLDAAQDMPGGRLQQKAANAGLSCGEAGRSRPELWGNKNRPKQQARLQAAHAVSPDGMSGAIAPEPSTFRPEPERAAPRQPVITLAIGRRLGQSPESTSAWVAHDLFDLGSQRSLSPWVHPADILQRDFASGIEVANLIRPHAKVPRHIRLK